LARVPRFFLILNRFSFLRIVTVWSQCDDSWSGSDVTIEVGTPQRTFQWWFCSSNCSFERFLQTGGVAFLAKLLSLGLLALSAKIFVQMQTLKNIIFSNSSAVVHVCLRSGRKLVFPRPKHINTQYQCEMFWSLLVLFSVLCGTSRFVLGFVRRILEIPVEILPTIHSNSEVYGRFASTCLKGIRIAGVS
jgi:hypothetical protein